MKTVSFLVAMILSASALFIAAPAFGAEAAAAAPAAEPATGFASKPEKRPWAMRDSYSFRTGNLRLYFFTDTAELYVATLDERVWMESSDFEIVLRNGDVIRGKDLDSPFVDRIPFQSELGEGLHFQAIFPPKDGLAVTFRVARFSKLGFLLLDILVKNERAEAVEIEKIRSLVIEPGTLKRLGPNTTSETKIINSWDDVTLFDTDKAPALILLKDYSEDAHLALAMMPKGLGEPVVSISAQDDGWSGEITTVYPATPLQPGKTLASNPTLISIGTADTSSLEETFAWGLSQMPGAAKAKPYQRSSTRPREHAEERAAPQTPAAAAADSQQPQEAAPAADAASEEAAAPAAGDAAAEPAQAEDAKEEEGGFFKRTLHKVKDVF